MVVHCRRFKDKKHIHASLKVDLGQVCLVCQKEKWGGWESKKYQSWHGNTKGCVLVIIGGT